MVKVFPIDFVRQTLEQKMLIEHLANPNYFGGKDQVNILSFYEQLKSQDEVDRFVETYRDLTEQQNRSGLTLNGVLVSPENPSITNLYSSLIIPMSFTCSLRSTLEDRDQSLETINNLIEKLKGRKVDIAQLKCKDGNGKTYYDPFVVETIGQNDGEPMLKNGDYVGYVQNANGFETIFNNLNSKGINILNTPSWVYCEHENKLKVAKKIATNDYFIFDDPAISSYIEQDGKVIAEVVFSTEENDYTSLPIIDDRVIGSLTLMSDNEEETEVTCSSIEIKSMKLENGHIKFILKMTCDNAYIRHLDSVTWADASVFKAEYDFIEDSGYYADIIFPPQHESFEKYKLSFSFDAVRCDEPRNLNGKEYCELSFGGSCTLVNEKAILGNDLIKIGIKRKKLIKSSGTTTYPTDKLTYLEPLEMPSGNNANTQINQLFSNKFKTNTHTDAIALTLQYTFIADFSTELIGKWFDYARYGDQTYITPNIIYYVCEIWSYWGNYTRKEIDTKIVENIEIENTESDSLTLSINMQIQGENN